MPQRKWGWGPPRSAAQGEARSRRGRSLRGGAFREKTQSRQGEETLRRFILRQSVVVESPSCSAAFSLLPSTSRNTS